MVQMNPFWSSRAQEEATVRMMRPSTLPQPSPTETVEEQATGRGKGRGGEMAKAWEAPRSWMEVPGGELHRGEGEDERPAAELARQLEVEMLHYLRVQNRQLQDEVQRLRDERHGSSGSSWARVTTPSPPEPPRPPTTPTRQVFATPMSPVRWTPGGTEVPSGPPPADDQMDGGWPEYLPGPWPKDDRQARSLRVAPGAWRRG